MKKSFFILFALCVFTYVSAQKTGTFKDPRDGKVYRTVTIGEQTWFAENLSWKPAVGSYAYNEDESLVSVYGRLYSFEAAKSACPAGWRLPSAEDWQVLRSFLGDPNTAAGKIKSVTGWKDPNTGATNESGFSALPGGSKYHSDGSFNNLGEQANFWSSTAFDCETSWYFYADYRRNKIYQDRLRHTSGFSVRCVKVTGDM